MGDPFRSDLEATRRRIEQLEAEHEKRVGELEEENRRLRARLVERAQEPGPRRRSPARVVLPIAMLLFGVSLGAGMLVARTRRATDVPLPGPMQEVGEAPAPGVGGFDRWGAHLALADVKVDDCAVPGGPHGTGHIRVTFAPSGVVVRAQVDEQAFAGKVGDCVESRYRGARVPAFGGSPVTVWDSFEITN